MRSLRQAKELSLLDLSKATRLGYTHLSRIENDSGIPNPETVVKLAEALDGDLAVMLEKANNLPRVIIDRLMNRQTSGAATKMQRAMQAGGEHRSPRPTKDLDQLVREADLSEEEKQDMSEAVEQLLLLSPPARRAIVQVINSYFPDGHDATL